MGFMIMESEVFEYFGDGKMLEASPFNRIVADEEHCRDSFWLPMDNVHDRDYLERLWQAERHHGAVVYNFKIFM